jgi:hypothetical protein
VETELLIETLLRKTMVEIARLATAGGARLPLARLQEQAFLELTRELSRQGVTTKVVADMLGVAPRTYHRRVQETQRSLATRARSVWQQVLELLSLAESMSAHAIKQRFVHESADLIGAVLHDLVHSGLARREGWGESAVFRATQKGKQLLLSLELRSVEPEGQIGVACQCG